MASSSSSSSSSPPSNSQLIKTYDVFVSFRGSDVRDGFLSFLVEALRGKDVYPFVDELLIRGEDVSRSLLDKIEDSYISLVIFSEKYAFSPWCLEELEKIVRCRETMGQIVIPVFYRIDPTIVQDLSTGEYRNALDEHRQNIQYSSLVESWHRALEQVSVLSGLVSYNIRPETKLVEEIVYHILEKIRSMGLNNYYNEELVGIDSRIGSVEELLCLDSQNVRIVGIQGAAGIGKSTIANKIYHRIKVQFTSHCLIENAGQKGSLLNEILYAILGQRISNESHCTILPLPIQLRLEKRKVLIVVDGVTDIKPLDLLLRKPDTIFGPGSRILITSREIKPLKDANAEIFEVKPLNNGEDLELFCLHAFKQRSPKQEFKALSERAVKYAGGIPSALKDLGSTLYYGSVEEWEDELENMKSKSASDQKIVKVAESEDQTVLKLSQFGSKKLTSELSSHSNLTVIWLTNSSECYRVPPLDQLYSLKELYFDNMLELEYVDCMGDNSVARGGKFFPSLKKLWIWNCPNLKGWRRKQVDDVATATQRQPWFPCLSLLEIKNCPKLSWIPLFPFLDERLYYVNSGSQPLQQTMKMRMESAQNYPLSKLQEFWISKLSELEYMDRSDDTSLYEEGESKLFPFLKKLWIEDCPNLKGWWKKRDEATTSTELPSFLCLSLLEIKNCPRLKCMPLFPSLEERLYYVNVATQPLHQTMKMKMEYSTTPLERVGELWISDVADLDYIDLNEDNYFNQGEGAAVFPFLKKLWIYKCPNLKGWWKRRDDDRAASTATAEQLPQFPCLSLLKIKQCPKLSWMPLFPSVDQRLYYVKTGVQPLLQTIMVSSFSSLKELWLSELSDLNYFNKSTVFLSLKHLWIDYCPNFEGWWRKTDEDTTSRQLPQFRWLSILKIKHCSKLSCMPLFPSVSKTLHYVAAGVEPLLQTMKMKTTLTNLTELWLSELPELEYIDSKEILVRRSTVLPSLMKLWIDYCPNLKGWWKESVDTIPSVELPQFPYLSLLEIKYCPKLRLMPQFTCLDDELKLEYASAEPLQQAMQMTNCLSKLKVMWIVGIEDMESLPKNGLQNLVSLRELHIKDCPRLASLPEEMRQLSSLVKLEIKGCPLLVGRCEENGAEWPNIEHIPDIETD